MVDSGPGGFEGSVDGSSVGTEDISDCRGGNECSVEGDSVVAVVSADEWDDIDGTSCEVFSDHFESLVV